MLQKNGGLDGAQIVNGKTGVVFYGGVSAEHLIFNRGDVWHNVKITRNKFKTAEGMPLKNYDKINAIAFVGEDCEFLINNALWV